MVARGLSSFCACKFGHECVDFVIADLDTLLAEHLADTVAEILSFLGSEEQSGSGAYDGTADYV